jgi:hypothetical protein
MPGEKAPVPMPVGRGRRAGLLALLASLVVLAFGIAAPAPAQAALPPQGLYEQCAPNSTTTDCGARLREMAAAGFKYVLNYTAWYGTPAQIRSYADQAQAAGIKLIWPLNHPAWRDGADLRSTYKYLAPSCGCDTNTAFKQFALGLVKDHPATWGFYIGDELLPTPQNISQVEALSNEVKAIAPDKPTMYVAMPRNEDLTQQLEPFASSADYPGADYYPLTDRNSNLGGVPEFASTTHDLATDAGRRPVVALQAFSWSQYLPNRGWRFPTEAEMQTMRDLAIRHGNPEMIFWYAYNDLVESDAPDTNWRNLQQAAFAPYIQVDGARAKCAGARVKLRVTVRTASQLRKMKATVDGRRVLRTNSELSKVAVRRLAPGRHRLRIVATDSSGNTGQQILKLRRCGS